jgi:hypothetical protein
MTLLQAVVIIIGVGFALALIKSIGTWNTSDTPKPGFADLAIPFVLKWLLYSGGVALAVGVQYLLFSARA